MGSRETYRVMEGAEYENGERSGEENGNLECLEAV